ncbi:MAG: hypothetical protein M4D80_24715 [Myxococcota bacterium]|nr:hypothetical protein [Myxococcota bacterium]
MANRSHLYAFDKFENGLPLKPRGLHEWNSKIPPSHLLMMSGKPRRYMSSIKPGQNVAIVADYEPGVARFRSFLTALLASKALTDELAVDVRKAEDFLASEAGTGRFLLLEPFEIFAGSNTAPDVQCSAVVAKQIPSVAAHVDKIVAGPPAQLFSKAPKWLGEVRENWGMNLGLGDWGPPLYYQLDA